MACGRDKWPRKHEARFLALSDYRSTFGNRVGGGGGGGGATSFFFFFFFCYSHMLRMMKTVRLAQAPIPSIYHRVNCFRNRCSWRELNKKKKKKERTYVVSDYMCPN